MVGGDTNHGGRVARHDGGRVARNQVFVGHQPWPVSVQDKPIIPRTQTMSCYFHFSNDQNHFSKHHLPNYCFSIVCNN